MQYLIFLVSLALLLLANKMRCHYTPTPTPPPTIRQTTNGPIEGVQQTSKLGQIYYAFLSIPYAEAPITGIDPHTGKQVDRRFKTPKPLRRQWTQPLKVQNPFIMCMPSEALPVEYLPSFFTEDCLVLSIFLPAGGSISKSVIVSFHGSGPHGGTTLNKATGPDFLLYHDNIVVFVEHRIQMYGFLNLGNGDYTGNMGLKDQQLALKWINRNIEYFSGNKNQILLYGQSWGAAFAHLHMMNKISRPLVARAFYASGTGLNPAFYPWRRPNQLQQLKTCFQITDTATLIDFLRTANSSILAECTAPVWIPVIENKLAPSAFLTDEPENILKSCDAPVMDAMFSFASQEAVAVFPQLTQSLVPLIEENWSDSTYLPPWIDFVKSAYPIEFQEMMEKLMIYYTPSSTDASTIMSRNLAIFSNTYLVNSILMSTIYQTEANKNAKNFVCDEDSKNTFLFRFGAHTDLNFFDSIYHLNYSGAAHAEDISHVFLYSPLNQLQLYDKHLQEKDAVYDLIMRSVKSITNFARTGDPTIDCNTPFKSCKSANQIYCTDITNDVVSPIRTNILDELYHQTWLDISNIYRRKDDSP